MGCKNRLLGGENMNAYELYLEDMLHLKDKEISIYKNFIEQQLGCKIKDEAMFKTEYNDSGMREVSYRVITIPESRYILRED